MFWYIVSAAVAIGTKIVFDLLSEREKKKQEKIKRDIEAVREKQRRLRERIEKIKREIGELGKELENPVIEERELASVVLKKYLERIDELVESRRRDYESIKDVRLAVERDLETFAFSSVRKREFRKWLLFLEEAIYKLEAYFEYLEWFRKRINFLFEQGNYESLIYENPPEPVLPEDYLYTGKLIKVKKDAKILESGRIYKNSYGQTLRIPPRDNPYRNCEIIAFSNYEGNEIPVLITARSKRFPELYYGSFVKGILLHDYGLKRIPLEAAVEEDWKTKVIVSLYNQRVGQLPREYKKQPLRTYKIGEPLNLYILEYDYLLKRVTFSEYHPEEVEKKESVEIFYPLEMENSEAFKKFGRLVEEEPLMLKEVDVEKKELSFVLGNIQIDVVLKNSFLFAKNLREIPPLTNQDKRKLIFVPFEVVFTPSDGVEFSLCGEENIGYFVESLTTEYLMSVYREDKSEIEEFINKWKEVNLLELSKGSSKDFEVEIEEIDAEEGMVVIKGAPELVEILRNFREEKLPSFHLQAIDGTFKEISKIKDFNIEKNRILLRLELRHLRLKELEKEFLLKRGLLSLPYNPYPVMKQIKAIDRFINDKEIVNSEIRKKILKPFLFRVESDLSPSKKIEFFNDKLTSNQKEVVEKALSSKEFFIIQGPPGTGKTTVITEIVRQTLKENPDSKILIVSQQNVAVDNVLERLKKLGFSSMIVRVASTDSKVSPELGEEFIGRRIESYRENLRKEEVLHHSVRELRNKWLQIIDRENVSPRAKELILSQFNVVGATCVGLANSNLGFDASEFDLVIVDEAGRANLGELLIPVNRAKKLILVGDHYQLPPTISAAIREEFYKLSPFEREFLEKSLFERLFEAVPEKLKGKLLEQFRMPEQIGTIVSELFYGGELRNGLVKDTSDFVYPDRVIQWINVNGKEKLEGTSRKNEKEAKVLMEKILEIQEICKERNLQKEIAVITPYTAQKRLLRQYFTSLLKENPEMEEFLNIKIDTVDAFQGKEADIVFYSTVRSRGNIKFLLDTRRLNVAISRARENLIFVGNKNFFKNAKTRGEENIFLSILEKTEMF